MNVIYFTLRLPVMPLQLVELLQVSLRLQLVILQELDLQGLGLQGLDQQEQAQLQLVFPELLLVPP